MPKNQPFARRRARDIGTAIAVLAAVAALALIVSRHAEDDISGRARVVDGDSLEIAGRRLRLRGIDAPELGQSCRDDAKTVSCGRFARDHLRRLIGGAPVDCQGWETDRYDRLLVICKARGTDLNAAMVRDGWALAYGGYEAEEAKARRAGRGLWATDFEAPADWRADAHLEGTQDGSSMIEEWARPVLTRLKAWLTSWFDG